MKKNIFSDCTRETIGLAHHTAKNALLKEVTGKTLIPDNQMINVEMEFPLLYDCGELTDENCLYCKKWIDVENDCSKCVMAQMGNHCGSLDTSTWATVSREWRYTVTKEERLQYKDLILQYNHRVIDIILEDKGDISDNDMAFIMELYPHISADDVKFVFSKLNANGCLDKFLHNVINSDELECTVNYTKATDIVFYGFNWHSTPEGTSYWSNINNAFIEALPKYEKYQIETVKGKKV